MKKYLIFALAAIAALSSCSDEEKLFSVETPSVSGSRTFIATIEDGTTRTTIDGNKVNWVSGDEVTLIFSDDQNNYTENHFVATPSASNAASATLTVKDGETIASEASNIMLAVYPSSYFSFGASSYFPATQVYDADNETAYAPMYFYNESPSDPMPEIIPFKNAGALLKITVPSSEFTSVKSITVSSDKAMNGEATFYPPISSMLILGFVAVTPESSKLTLDCYSKTGSNVEIPSGGSKTFYISILPLYNGSQFTSYGYLQIDVTDGTTTKSMRTNKPDGITIERNKIYPISFADQSVTWPSSSSDAIRKPTSFDSSIKSNATSIEIQVGVTSLPSEESSTAIKINDDGSLWAVYEGTTLYIRTKGPKIIMPSDVSNFFDGYENVTSISGLEYFDMSGVILAQGMFKSCKNLATISGLENWDMSNAIVLFNMFQNCENIQKLDLSKWDISNVEYLSGLFSDCKALTSIGDVSGWNTSKVTEMQDMFLDCNALTYLDLSEWNTSNVNESYNMFSGCNYLATIIVGDNFTFENNTQYNNMFNRTGYDVSGGCTVFGANSEKFISVIESNKSDFKWDDSRMHFGTQHNGTTTATIDGSDVSVKWVQLWSDGPKFAEYNVGTDSENPYGGYYCWGKTVNKDPNNAFNAGTSTLSGADDTATALWGSHWRMMTAAELDALIANTTSEWTTVNGIAGRKFTGNGAYAADWIFLPAASVSYNGNLDNYYLGVLGYYSTSTPGNDTSMYQMYFSSDTYYSEAYGSRLNAVSVRAVVAE